jgi:FG-GAP-like repeat
MLRTPAVAVVAAVMLNFAPTAAAQLGEPWVTFTKQPAQLALPPTALSDADTEVLFRTGDLDQDAWDDVVAVRKQQAGQVGKRTAFLLMNVNGVLTDKTALDAAASDVPGDFGFLTPCNNRRSALGDVDGDGWLDVVTSAVLSDGAPKSVSHPRVYRNRADDGSGAWQGLIFENARIPQLMTLGAPPLAVAPRFNGVALGDVTGDGAPDLYFVDFDTPETGIVEPLAWDLNDRLLVNDGHGYFTDEGAVHLTPVQLESQFGVDVQMADVNADGLLDIVKATTLDPPRNVRIVYNNPAQPGNFTPMGTQDVNTGGPYGMDLADLNHDAFLDIAIVDDGRDKFRLGTGYDALNRMIWGPLKTFTFLDAVENEQGRDVYIRDLDGDGWNDVLIPDVDNELTGCSRRLHIYHNRGTVPGDMDLPLVEEVEQVNGEFGAGWKGAVGLSAADAKGSYDVGFGDWDRDGDLDLLLATCNGTQFFRNETNPNGPDCQADLGFAGPGNMHLSLCGDSLTEPGGVSMLRLSGAAPNAPLYIPVSLSIGPAPLKGGLLVPFPVLLMVSGFTTDGSGQFTAPVPGSAGAPLHVYMQCLVKHGTVLEFSNALDVTFGV